MRLVSRWAFIEWLAILGRLSTKDRLQSWGFTIDNVCLLCQGGEESHEHLFFERSYSQVVWKMILLKNNVHRPYSGLATELEWTCAHKSSDSASNSVYKLSVAAAIYWLWREQNRRQFQGVGLPAQNLGAQIIDEVRSVP